MELTKAEKKFWRKELSTLDRVYKAKMSEWQRLLDQYDLKFSNRIRDLKPEEMVKISRFYPIARQIISSTSFNYPKLFFAIEEAEGQAITQTMERASDAVLEIMDMKPHVHQVIFDALFCSVGWMRIDFNKVGDDLIPPYTANTAAQEDFTSVSRVPPWMVHVDPQCPPHRLSHARYIREKMWIPMESLKADDRIKRKSEITPTAVSGNEDIGFGESYSGGSNRNTEFDGEEMQALRESIENGNMVLCDRIHDRINRRLIMFASGVSEAIMVEKHPFAKQSFPEALDPFGDPILDEEGQPIFRLKDGQDIPGWLVHDGFALIPMKFDQHAQSYYPRPHFAYLEDLQSLVVESMSRRAALLKRTSRQGLANKRERLENPNLLDDLRKGVDGQWHEVLDTNNFKELAYGEVPTDQLRIEQDAIGYEQEISRTSDFDGGGDTPITATQASLVGAQFSVNRQAIQTKVSEFYVNTIRSCFQIFGDPRYRPENFMVNVAPDGQQAIKRVLTNADFLWTYKIKAQTGSMQPLFEQIQSQKFLEFYDRAYGTPNFDKTELDRMLAMSVNIVDVEKVMVSNLTPEATRAAQMENEQILQGKDPGVFEGQDHKTHMDTHNKLEEAPQLQQAIQSAQETDLSGAPIQPQLMQQIQQIIQVRDQHNAAHEQAIEQEQNVNVGTSPPSNPNLSLESTVRGNAQNVSNTLDAGAYN